MKTYTLSNSPVKGKRFRIDMIDHHHDFASDVGKTFIDHKDNKLNYFNKNIFFRSFR